MKNKKKKFHIHPYILIILTFIAVILIGSILLVMPFAKTDGHSMAYIDSLFMSTSAVCVTGLSVMENGLRADLTLYGQIVMLVLMEIGGLSIITIGIFFFTILGAKIGISTGFILKESLNQNNLKDLLPLVKKIIIISLSIQTTCALINLYPFHEYLKYYGNDSIGSALWLSFFHSGSAFNNAGFDIIHGCESLIEFSMDATVISPLSRVIFNLTTMFMIFTGGIGFVVINDILTKRRWAKLTLHTKITLITTFFLIITGAIVIKFGADINLMDAFFTAFTSRTAGFQTFRMSELSNLPIAYMTIVTLMFIGASPCSCGGGIKTTTFAVIFIAIFNFARGNKNRIFERRLNESQIVKAFILITMAFIVLVIAIFMLIVSEPNIGFMSLIFEAVSAFSTTGLSMGITTSLNIFSKLVLISLMLFGRLGILTILGVLNKNWMNKPKESVEFIEESVFIG